MTYLYETIPAREGAPVKHYEFKQGAQEPALTRHPDTGEPIRRVILGGWGLVTSKPTAGSSSQGNCGCGPAGCC